MKESDELHCDAMQILKHYNIPLGKQIKVRANFSQFFKEDYPFIGIKYKNGKIQYYHSEHKVIKHLMFESEKEVILANAIYENTKDNFNINEFIQTLKYTFRLIGIKNEWS